MSKKPTYTQLKAKKKWLLHTSSSKSKFKSKTKLTSQKRRRHSLGSEHMSSSQKQTLFKSLAQISGLLSPAKDSDEVLNISTVKKKQKWLVNASMEAVLLPINMALCALMNGTHFFKHYFEAACKAIGIAGKSLNNGIKKGVRSVDAYQRKVVQSTTDTVFPSLSFKRKFDELNERINDLEQEIKKIKTSHSEHICTKCEHGSSASVPVSGREILLPPAPIPPPPPPPPPPPLLPALVPLNFTQKKKSNASNTQDKPTIIESQKGLVVSIDDIKSVKLRKAQPKPVHTKSPAINKSSKSTSRQPLKEVKNHPAKTSGQPLVTMEELRGIKLRKKAAEKKQHHKSFFKTPENNIVVLRRNLKKVSLKRSPGGTPLDKAINETGLGLTPMITRALRKKFQHANPPSASPEEPTSPRKRLRGISFSPMQDTTPVFTSPSMRL